MDELRVVAPKIGIALTDDGTLTDAEAARVFDVGGSGPYNREYTVWLTLWESCRESIAQNTAIVFT